MEKQTALPALLVVEDSNEDFEILNRIIGEVRKFDLSIVRCLDGDDALDYLMPSPAQKNDSLPDMILLDLNLPGIDGREVITELKQNTKLKMIPIVVLTTSSNPKDISDCYRSGVNAYMLKSMDLGQFKASIQHFLDFWFEATILPSPTQ